MAVRLSQIHVAVMRPKSGTVPVDAQNVFALDDSGDLLTAFGICTNSFVLSQLSTHQYVYGVCSNAFVFVAATGINQTVDVLQYLGLTVRNVQPVSNTMFQNASGQPPRGSLLWNVVESICLNNFGWDEDVIRAYRADDSLGFVQVIFPNFPRDIYDVIGFHDEADLSDSEYDRDENQHCCKQHLTYTLNTGPCVTKNYNPFIGSSSAGDYDEMETTAPVLVKQTLTLQYPIPPLVGGDEGNTIFDFKNPTFGNGDSLQFTVIDRTTRGGDRIIYGDPKWAKAQLFDYQIINVKKSVMEEFVAFVNMSLGKNIGITDWFGQQFIGVIVAPESPIQETVSGYTITLRFQGEPGTW